jgi:uncharacterized membrane protein
MKDEVLEKLTQLVTAAFGLVAALAWNDAIKSLFVEGGVLEFLSASGQWAYAVLVTVLAVTVTIYLGRLQRKNDGS